MNLRLLSTLSILALTPLAASAQSTSAALYSSSAAPASVTSAATIAPGSESYRPFSSAAVALKFGAAGIGFDLATPIVSWLNLRGGASFFSYNTTLVEDGANISGAIKFQNASAMLDIFPFRNRFRISGGMTIFNNTGFNAALTVPAGNSFSVGNNNYTSDPSDPIHGSGTFNFGGRTAPRVSVGFGNMLPRRGHWALESEAGFQYISRPTVLYVINGSGCTGPNNTNCGPIVQSDVNQQQTNLQNDLSGLRFFPILSIGLSYKAGPSHTRTN
jgi:hypothetical protein